MMIFYDTLYQVFYDIRAEGPGVARGNFFWKNECPKKCYPNRSSRLAGYTQHIYMRMSCFII